MSNRSKSGARHSGWFHAVAGAAILLASVGVSRAAERDPAEAIAGLDVAPGLQVQLFASEPMVASISSMDIDARGRVWVCELINYRGHKNDRREGDRILILEDTNHDGVADKSTVFFQSREIDSAHGVCVLPHPSGKGSRVLVSAGSKILDLYDDNGDDKADRAEPLFTGIAGTQHDHGIHAATFGPDGKLYFNFGNAGKELRDAKGQPITDLAGNIVLVDRKSYQQGMVFRCEPDGSSFETLGWNFRNNWMVVPDSFGSLWQSDNDDDGNRAVRINFVMEYGNYGYRDEITRAGWKEPRANIEAEIPDRHWHVNDPGVVPNLLITGAGAPTGICIYEGSLLPPQFRGQMIHCDAGPNVVRAYPVQPQGAGYTATIVPILSGTRDKWFRPTDVKVAPDGSLFVTDWYDPGVGGHGMRDMTRGRVFRITPQGHQGYQNPAFDLGTAEGCVSALQSPNVARRAAAWLSLKALGTSARPALEKLWRDSKADSRLRARALWLLIKLDPSAGNQAGKPYILEALRESDPNLRIAALRAAKQVGLGDSIAAALVKDADPAVRREVAIALRHSTSPQTPELWGQLAASYAGGDRWYLEALGLASDLRAAECFAAYVKLMGGENKVLASEAGRDIVWRVRSEQAIPLLVKLLSDPAISASDKPRYLRSLDFHPDSPARQQAITKLLDSSDRAIAGYAATQLSPQAVKKDAALQQKVRTLAASLRGQASYVELVQRFQLHEEADALMDLAIANPEGDDGSAAARALLDMKLAPKVEARFKTATPAQASSLIRALGRTGHQAAGELLAKKFLDDASAAAGLRRDAVRALALTKGGAQLLLGRAKDQKLAADLVPAASAALATASWSDVRKEAATLLPPPQAAGGAALPPASELLKIKGVAARGKEVFVKLCMTCHKADGVGVDFAPSLAEIGDKLGKDAILDSILDPSAAISEGFTGQLIETSTGDSYTGIVVSETDAELIVKMPGGVKLPVPRASITRRTNLQLSIMPQGLQAAMTAQELADLLQFLSEQRKAK